jgi:hypothetical protein
MTRRLPFILTLGYFAAASVAGAQRDAGLKVLGARAATPDVGVKIFVPTGSVRLIAWDRDSIVVRGRVGAGGHFFFARGETNASYKLGVETRRADASQGPSDFVINVPRRAEISVKTVDATITGEGVGGWFYTVSGAIRLSGDAEHVDAESIRGDVDLDVMSMLVKARTGRGHVTVRGSPEDVDASTISGPLDVESPAIRRGRFSSVTGNLRYAANPAPGSIFDFSDHAGTIDLFLPRSASSRLDLSTVTGFIQGGGALRRDDPNSLRQFRPSSAGGQTLTVRLGAGEAHMTVRTFKGAIRLLPK